MGEGVAMTAPARSAAEFPCELDVLAPPIRQLRDDIERKRTLAAELVSAMRNVGSFSLWLSRDFGGPELSFAEYAQAIDRFPLRCGR
jgi:hypothetical protein